MQDLKVTYSVQLNVFTITQVNEDEFLKIFDHVRGSLFFYGSFLSIVDNKYGTSICWIVLLLKDQQTTLGIILVNLQCLFI